MLLKKKAVISKHKNFISGRKTTAYFNSYQPDTFIRIEKGNCKFDSKIKKALDIHWNKLNLGTKRKHLALILSL